MTYTSSGLNLHRSTVKGEFANDSVLRAAKQFGVVESDASDGGGVGQELGGEVVGFHCLVSVGSWDNFIYCMANHLFHD
jgi:hypothetical protein